MAFQPVFRALFMKPFVVCPDPAFVFLSPSFDTGKNMLPTLFVMFPPSLSNPFGVFATFFFMVFTNAPLTTRTNVEKETIMPAVQVEFRNRKSFLTLGAAFCLHFVIIAQNPTFVIMVFSAEQQILVSLHRKRSRPRHVPSSTGATRQFLVAGAGDTQVALFPFRR